MIRRPVAQPLALEDPLDPPQGDRQLAADGPSGWERLVPDGLRVDAKRCGSRVVVCPWVVGQSADTLRVLAGLVVVQAEPSGIILVHLEEGLLVEVDRPFRGRVEHVVIRQLEAADDPQPEAADGPVGQQRVRVASDQSRRLVHPLGRDVVEVAERQVGILDDVLACPAFVEPGGWCESRAGLFLLVGTKLVLLALKRAELLCPLTQGRIGLNGFINAL